MKQPLTKTLFALVTRHKEAIVIVALALCIRLYRIRDYATFLGDQGRDTIVMHDIATLSHFPALGPITSIGSMYLGPLYYYLSAPWLLLAGFDPVGPALGVAVMFSLSLFAVYVAVNNHFNKHTALLAIFFAATSATLVEQTRFSWNPNLISPVSFLALFATVKCIQKPRMLWFALLGLLLSTAIQFHYLALTLFPVIGITLIVTLAGSGQYKRTYVRGIGVTAMSFLALLSPFVLFEIKHKFPNIISFINFFQSSPETQGNVINQFFHTANRLMIYALDVNVAPAISVVMLIALASYVMYGAKRKTLPWIYATMFLGLLVVSALYKGAVFPHYLGFLYITFFVLVSYALSLMTKRWWGMFVVVLLCVAFLWQQVAGYQFLHNGPSRRIERSRQVADKILEHVTGPYRLTGLPEQYNSLTIRYFLIKNGSIPLDPGDTAEKGGQLFVVCEGECEPTKSPMWDIAFFSASEQKAVYNVEEFYIYELIR